MRILLIFGLATWLPVISNSAQISNPTATQVAHPTTHVGVDQRNGTGFGSNHCLLFDDHAVYPAGCTFTGENSQTLANRKADERNGTRRANAFNDPYGDVHVFLSDPVWAPDGSRVALVERIFDWQYNEPFRYLDGTATHLRYQLTIIPEQGSALAYRLGNRYEGGTPQWVSGSQIRLGNQSFDLLAHPPVELNSAPKSFRAGNTLSWP